MCLCDVDSSLGAENMSDVNDAIHAWRLELQQQGGVSADDVAELESHLAEEMESLQRTGLRPDEAFVIATRRLGRPFELAAEYSKNDALMSWKRPARLLLWGLLLMEVMSLCFSAILLPLSAVGLWDVVGVPWLRNLSWLSTVTNCSALGVLWVLAAKPQGTIARSIVWLEQRIGTNAGAVTLLVATVACEFAIVALRICLLWCLTQRGVADLVQAEYFTISMFLTILANQCAWTIPVAGSLVVLAQLDHRPKPKKLAIQ